MTALSSSQNNLNLLAQNNFLYRKERCPTVAFFTQRASLPGITLASVNEYTPFSTIPQPGDNVKFSPLSFDFKVDEDLKNYFEIVDWVFALGRTKNSKQLEDYLTIDKKPHSSITLLILDGQKIPHYNITYNDCIPVSLTSLNFNVDDNDVKYITATASFVYSYYEYEKLYSEGDYEKVEIE